MRRIRTALIFVLAMSAIACAACGDRLAAGPECTRSAKQLRALDRSLTRCAADADCPCGSACALGVCSYECIADDECGTAAPQCDDRGRCVP
jgi:hypothetical protein